MATILYFYSHNPRKNDAYQSHVFSQWYPSSMKDDKYTYWCCEQYMMAKKALLFATGQFKEKNLLIHKQIMEATKQYNIKALGRQVVGFDENIWEKNRLQIVIDGNILKFTQNDKLKQILIDTKNMLLAEASPYDKIWGIGLNLETAKTVNKDGWNGLNLLGEALMVTRRQIIGIDHHVKN